MNNLEQRVAEIKKLYQFTPCLDAQLIFDLWDEVEKLEKEKLNNWYGRLIIKCEHQNVEEKAMEKPQYGGTHWQGSHESGDKLIPEQPEAAHGNGCLAREDKDLISSTKTKGQL